MPLPLPNRHLVPTLRTELRQPFATRPRKVARDIHLLRILKEPPLRIVHKSLLRLRFQLTTPLQIPDEDRFRLFVQLLELMVRPTRHIGGVDEVLYTEI